MRYQWNYQWASCSDGEYLSRGVGGPRQIVEIDWKAGRIVSALPAAWSHKRQLERLGLETMPRRASYLDKDESRIYKRALPEVGGRTCIVVPPFGENSAS